MTIVVSLVKLVLLLLLGLACLLGQGWFAVGSLIHGQLTRRTANISLLQELPLTILAGLIVNYGITLVVQSLRVSLGIGGLVSVIGLFTIILGLRQTPAAMGSRAKWAGAAVVCLLFIGPILGMPLMDWDARSIWFFHAKMIYTAGSLGRAAGWEHPATAFSFSYYPQLIPALSAQIANVWGFWNEYLPKLSLFFLLVPAVMWLFTFARRSMSSLFLLMLFPAIFSAFMWNGYMDGYLALYFSVGLLHLGRFLKTSDRVDLLAALGCLSLMPYLKNEGIPALIAALVSLALLFANKGAALWQGRRPAIRKEYVVIGCLAFVPLVVWEFYKRKWGLHNPYIADVGDSYSRLCRRLVDGSIALVVRAAIAQIGTALVVCALLSLAAIASVRSALNKSSLQAALAACVYGLVILAIYLTTPYDLPWQLKTSIERTMMPVSGGILVAAYFVLYGVENAKSRHPQEVLQVGIGGTSETTYTNSD